MYIRFKVMYILLIGVKYLSSWRRQWGLAKSVKNKNRERRGEKIQSILPCESTVGSEGSRIEQRSEEPAEDCLFGTETTGPSSGEHGQGAESETLEREWGLDERE